ncbi:MAG: phosphodiester glycosidase family protein [Bacteroidota bacterium]|nr:phosphodiester glycosidase family protein [Bacteroidota bacterium]
MTVKKMMAALRAENINTWFDLGLFIDKFKEEKKIPQKEFDGEYFDFKKTLKGGGIGFLSFYYSVDGVTIEVNKYAQFFKSIIKDVKIHYIAGEFKAEADKLIDADYHKHCIKEIKSFDQWQLYRDFFFTKLQRGSKEYNELILKFWKEVLVLSEKLGKYIEENNINLLYIINVNSNPGNVSLSLANVLVSEYLGIPVINNCHDYYWEGGNREVDVQVKGLKKGPRDFFFKNSHVGEFFSQIEVLFPWESRSWMTVNINENQNKHIIEKNGHNPANTHQINTAVDTNVFKTISKREKINAFYQIKTALSNYQEDLKVCTVDEVIEKMISSQSVSSLMPVLVGSKSIDEFDFIGNNIVFLQPTRIISRKKIEVNFKLIEKLFKNNIFIEKFKSNPHLNLTIIVSGPISSGQNAYFFKLLKFYDDFLKTLTARIRKRIFIGFLFSELDKSRFINHFEKPIGIPELYNIASLILLPSETEGRGLPIIEATACGIPIFCRRYFPENVYSEVIGENLEEELRLKVFEFDGKRIPNYLVDEIAQTIIFPQSRTETILHNRNAIEKRYSLNALYENMDTILFALFLQLKTNKEQFDYTKSKIEEYEKHTNFRNKYTNLLINEKNRHYMPGSGRLAFMLYLKSLIDPSFFRVEEMEIRGYVFDFAKILIDNLKKNEEIPIEKIHKFYNSVENIFYVQKGESSIRHDHSFAYRHRNKKFFPYQQFTHQELTGLVNLLYNDIFKPQEKYGFKRSLHFFTDWNLAMSQLTNSATIEIDDREILLRYLNKNVPFAYFPGRYIQQELEYFVLQPIRQRLDLKINDNLTEEMLEENSDILTTIYIFLHEKQVAKRFSANGLDKYLKTNADEELQLLYKMGICKIVKTKQLCVGIHFPQLGKKALKILSQIKTKKGFLITNGDNAPIMSDIVNIDRFHLGKAEKIFSAKIMGISAGSGFIQFVPAGLRTTLAYPTPIQTSKDFSKTIKSDEFNDLSEKLGEEGLLRLLQKDAEKNGSPVKQVLKNIKKELGYKEFDTNVETEYVSGIYDDGLPYSGIIAKVNLKENNWMFAAFSDENKPKPVPELTKLFNKKTAKTSQLAWNGGYILNPELVGKLGLPETYIGSPLGLLIIDEEVVSAPLFNKPSFIIHKNGKIDIQRVSIENGIKISADDKLLDFNKTAYNKHSEKELGYFNLMSESEFLKGNGNYIVRLAGNTIKEVVKTKKGEDVKIIPVGLTLSIPEKLFPEEWNKVNKKVKIEFDAVNGFDLKNIAHAIEAGPLLINDGELNVDMITEGWKTSNSIKTQAARLDYTDMRGPKISVGLDKDGNPMVLMINGRIKESVGATHFDMANILMSYGAKKAMGFDPGGSSTLVVDGKTMNISPYNKDYEKNIYSLPPEPRFVANAIIGWCE